MAGFPSRRVGEGSLRQRRTRSPKSDRRGLAHERLERRTPLAADSFDAYAPYEYAAEQWSLQADIVAMPCTDAPVDAPVPVSGCDVSPVISPDCPPEALSDMAPGCAPSFDPDGAQPLWPVPPMSAESDFPAELLADGDARRMADMQTAMSLFHLNVPRLDATDAVSGPDSMNAPTCPPLDDMTAPDPSQSPATLAASLGGTLPGDLMASEFPPIDRTVTPRGSPVGKWVPPDVTGLTMSGVTPSHMTAVEIPTYSLSTGDMATEPPGPVAPETHVLMVSAISGGIYDPQAVWAAQQQVVESTRWTATDREAKTAAREAYDVDDGGLLRSIGVAYYPGADESPYGRWGFSAHLTYSEDTGTYYLAYRGTEDFVDVLTDINQGWFMRASQFDQAIALAKDVQRKLGDAPLILTGHSLGGALAAAAAYATGVNASVFNPASVSLPYRSPIPVRIRSHVIFGDILSIARTISNGLPSGDIPDPKLRFAPGMIILHPPRSINPITSHSLDSFPE